MNVDYDSIIHVLGLSNDCDKIHAYTLIQKLNLRVYVFVCVFVCMYVCMYFLPSPSLLPLPVQCNTFFNSCFPK